MATKSFRDLTVWIRASNYTVRMYQAFCQDYSFRDQIQRALLFITNNNAEGYARRSDKSFRHFLSIAKGLAAETESMLWIAEKLQYIDMQERDGLLLEVDEISRMLAGFMKKLQAKDA